MLNTSTTSSQQSANGGQGTSDPLTRPREWVAARLPWWITPNLLSLSRLVLVVLIVWVDFSGGSLGWVFFLGFVAAVSDLLDGPLARVRGCATRLGAFLDPLGDKFMTVAVVLILWRRNLLFTPEVVGIFATDLHGLVLPVFTILRRLCMGRSIMPLPEVIPNVWGKLKTAALALGMLSIAAGALFGSTPWLDFGHVVVWLSIVMGLWASFLYYKQWFELEA